jgi:hypothetical protein
MQNNRTRKHFSGCKPCWTQQWVGEVRWSWDPLEPQDPRSLIVKIYLPSVVDGPGGGLAPAEVHDMTLPVATG